jgi:hypothetical protein
MKNDIGIMIINEHSVFKGYSLFLRNEKTVKCSIETVLEFIKEDDKKKVNINGEKIIINLSEKDKK